MDIHTHIPIINTCLQHTHTYIQAGGICTNTQLKTVFTQNSEMHEIALQYPFHKFRIYHQIRDSDNRSE